MRKLPRHLAVAVLMAGILTAYVPLGAQAAEEPVPTASASAEAGSSNTAAATATVSKDAPVTVGEGELIAIGKVQVLEPGTDKSIAQLAIGDHIKYTSFDRRDEFNASYTVTTDLGQHGSVGDTFVVSMPAKGLALDQRVVINKTAAAKSDVLSMMGGPLGAAAYDIYSAPTGEAEVIGRLLPGQKYLASKPQAGATSLFGSSQWIAILTDPATGAYGWIHAESAAIDEHPDEAAVVTTPEPADAATAEATEIAAETPTPEVTASSTPTPAVAAPAAQVPAVKKNTTPVIGLGAGAVVLIVAGATVAAKRKRRAEEEDGDEVVPAEVAAAVTVAPEAPAEAASAEVEDPASYWEEED
ncbi:hypothetical protein [Arthrobacter sp. STN4]|uniref:hypothetical protein n=1 Tax=Arthrobacter sp. STN4 TaxID=2923276 RepID=UPI002119FDD8|nr:hypothetical protein [Arthrobacter sp. STN4]MCQ9162931.1 hypothetical protein [Arthrobacter sp. STN4]